MTTAASFYRHWPSWACCDTDKIGDHSCSLGWLRRSLRSLGDSWEVELLDRGKAVRVELRKRKMAA